MGSNGKGITREASRATGTFLFFPKGALTHHPGGAVVFPLEIVRSPRGIRLLRKPDGQCHISADLLSSSTQLVCGKRSQNTVASTDSIPPTARTNLPQHRALPSVAAALSAVMTISIADSHFLFHKEKQKLYERPGTNEWQFTIWKQRWSAVEKVDPLSLLPHI